jgi:hypothetical protein
MNPNKYQAFQVKRYIPEDFIKDVIKQLSTGTTWISRSLSDYEHGLRVRVRYRSHTHRDDENKKLIQYLVTNDERRRIMKEVLEREQEKAEVSASTGSP